MSEIIINETVDGVAAKTPSASGRKRASSGNDDSGSAPARPKHDPYIWGIYLALLCFSIVELFSASSTEITGSNVYEPLIRHCVFLGIGFVLVIGLQNTHYGYFSRFAMFCAVVSLVLLVLSTWFIGAEINGAQRAIKIAGFTIQPPEIVKLTVVVLLATILGKNQEPGGVTTKAVITVSIIVLVFAGILWINGLTNTILLMLVSICMFLIGGIQMKKLVVVAVVYLMFGGVVYLYKYAANDTTEYDNVAAQTTSVVSNAPGGAGRAETHTGRLKRYIRGVKPDDEIDDFNRQVVFANMAQANGGAFGQGPGNSRENARLPLAFSDYIFSIVVEDTGFLGGSILLLLYLLLLGRAGRIAYKCRRAFPAFLIMGCALLIVAQALVHMAIVTGVAPVSGQPLPLISKGGTSVVIMSMAIGIMLSVSRFAVSTSKTDRQTIKDELNQLPADMQAANIANQ